MTSYFNTHYGDLQPGHVAKSSDIMLIQQNIEDAFKNAINDLTEGQSWIIGNGVAYDDEAFLLTPEKKRAGRYIDQMVLAENNDADILSIREVDYRQPIKMSRSSLYSVIVKLQNKSEDNVNVCFELHNEEGDLIPSMKRILTLPRHTNTPEEFEIIFDLQHYPTAHNLEPEDLENDSNEYVQKSISQDSAAEGHDFGTEQTPASSTAGATTIYLYVQALNKSKEKAFDINKKESSGYRWNDEDPTFGIVINKNSTYGQLLEENVGSGYVQSSKKGDLYFKEVFANAPVYRCKMGEAVINGEKVVLSDTHVVVGATVDSGNLNLDTTGKILSYVYMDTLGRLQCVNSAPFIGSEPAIYPEVTDHHLHIANIITFFDGSRDPIIEQSDDTQVTRPRSHHERLRRIEKKLGYIGDISIPPRFKYTLTGEDWIDTTPEVDLYEGSANAVAARSIDSLNGEEYVPTIDVNGNFIIKLNKSESFSIPITLKEETSGIVDKTDKEKTIIKTAQTSSYIDKLQTDDTARAQVFAEMKNVSNDIKEGTLSLENQDSGIIVATTDKEAKVTEFNPWDDTKENRPAKADIKPTTRSYDVVSGKNGSNDWDSEFPAMTLYLDKTYNMKKLQIPIYKFKNCTGVKFIIWERQSSNNKTNTVWFKKKIWTSDEFSLKDAKEKQGYLYKEDGFILDFGKKGKEFPKGQYVIVCFPVVKSGTGTVYVDTYKPEKSKDFCIRYHGAANGSHFLLKTRYQEIWYNSAKAQAEEVKYSKTGSVTSGVVSFTNKEPIKTIKPLINVTNPKNTSTTIYVDVGGGWVKVEPDKETSVVGSGAGSSFKWKIEFKSNEKDTPIIKYDKEKKYAIKFEITRAEPQTANAAAVKNLDKNLCFTSKVFDANEILREYIGDMNFALQESKFSNFEFARIWGTDTKDNKMLIDISASDRVEAVKLANGTDNLTRNGQQVYYPVYSLHYVDLTLDDIPNVSVDYSNYDTNLENDEHNLRLKLDTENSYNDDDIDILGYNQFKLTNSEYNKDLGDGESGLGIDLTKINPSQDNQIIAKAKLDNHIDLSKYGGIKIGLTLNGTNEGSISGLAFYISSQYESEAPSNVDNSEIAAIPDVLPDLNVSQEDTINTYANQIVYREVSYNGTSLKVYYKSVWNSSTGAWEWNRLYDVKSCNIYKIIDRSEKTNTLSIKAENNGKKVYYELEIDPNDINLQYAKEFGLMILNDEGYSRTNVDSIILSDFKAIKEDYYAAFDASNGTDVFVKRESRSPIVCHPSGSLEIPKSNSATEKWKETIPKTSSIKITHQQVLSEGEYLCFFNMTSKSTEKFNHIGIQLAADTIITKYMLELHLIKKDKNDNRTVIEKIRIPTLNYIYYSTVSNNKINLSQIFKKIKTTEKFDEIGIYATSKFVKYAKKIKTKTKAKETDPEVSIGDSITLYIGKIVLYKATSIPILYPKMRMKIYLDEVEEIKRSLVGIRKLGVVIQYK